jgi:aspartate aminotransferase-like enzyme
MIGVSARAWAATEKATLPRFYWDLRTARKSLEKGQTPYTPPVSLYFGLTWLWG